MILWFFSYVFYGFLGVLFCCWYVLTVVYTLWIEDPDHKQCVCISNLKRCYICFITKHVHKGLLYPGTYFENLLLLSKNSVEMIIYGLVNILILQVNTQEKLKFNNTIFIFRRNDLSCELELEILIISWSGDVEHVFLSGISDVQLSTTIRHQVLSHLWYYRKLESQINRSYIYTLPNRNRPDILPI